MNTFNHIRVVIADNNPIMLEAIRQLLESAQMEVIDQARDGEQAIRLTKTVSQGQTFLSQRIQHHTLDLISNVLLYKSQLSSREQELACLVAKDKSNQEIAHQLFITPSTVKCHIKSIRRKLGVDSRLGIAMQALRLGLICMGEIEEELQLV